MGWALKVHPDDQALHPQTQHTGPFNRVFGRLHIHSNKERLRENKVNHAGVVLRVLPALHGVKIRPTDMNAAESPRSMVSLDDSDYLLHSTQDP